ncbi:unnamed protein product [Discula destructiva]
MIIVVDRQPVIHWRGHNEADCRNAVFEEGSVLLVRTGHEEHLSAPIDFSELCPALLPLDRDDLALEQAQVARVRLRTAVRFIMDLERSERECSPRLTAMKKVLDNDTFRAADCFPAEALGEAESNGSIDRNWETWKAVRRARAYLDGDHFYVDGEMAKADREERVEVRRW